MASWASFTPYWSISDPIFEGFWSSQPSKIIEKHKEKQGFSIFSFSYILDTSRLIFDLFWIVLEPTWGLGELSWSLLGASRGPLGASWAS